MIDTARRPQPLLAVGASLCALGALMGRKYRTETNLRSNLYMLATNSWPRSAGSTRRFSPF
jgi:hypothetical protein